MIACTIIAKNYLARAEVLACSFLSCHSGARFYVLVIDDDACELSDSHELYAIVRPRELGIPLPLLSEMIAFYEVVEFATALKPFLLAHLIDKTGEAVTYLDPDIEVFHDFSEAFELADRHQLVLTPHVLRPIPRDGLLPDERHILVAGVFNLGFIALGSANGEFLEWWKDRLIRGAVVDPAAGLFTDQRWIDLVPILFNHYVLRDPTFNVAYWNVFERPLEWVDGGYRLDKGPMRFFHFSGFDPDTPHLLSKFQGDRPRTLLSEHPVLAKLCRDYAEKVKANGEDSFAKLPYGYSRLSNGLPYDARMRRLYREAVLTGQPCGASVPDPFAPAGPDEFIAWLNEPGGTGSVPRYADAVWRERGDLQMAFPDPSGQDRHRFFHWLATEPWAIDQVPPELRPPIRLSAASSSNRLDGGKAALPGVNVAGYFHAEMGVGEAGRSVVAAVEEAGIPFITFGYRKTLSRQLHPFRHSSTTAFPYDINIVCVNADQIGALARDVSTFLSQGRYTIGVWFWETEIFPETLAASFDAVDEIWVASEFTRKAIVEAGSKPVRVFPMPVLPIGCATHCTKEELGLPPGFVFLFCFDFFSVFRRKNPLAVVEAFRRAFQPGEGASLVIKTINGGHCLEELELLRAAASDHPDIHVRDEYMAPLGVRAMTELSDCYVSLHRSEGFGLTMFTAVALGKPVIATAYSGNMTFMQPDTNFLVPYEVVPIGPGCGPYPPEGTWAEPSVDDAARRMREVFEMPEAAGERGEEGRRYLERHHGLAVAARFIRRRLTEIREDRTVWGEVGETP